MRVTTGGPHAFSACKAASEVSDAAFCYRVPPWVDDSIEWLKDIFGDFAPNGYMTKPKCLRKFFADNDGFLSKD